MDRSRGSLWRGRRSGGPATASAQKRADVLMICGDGVPGNLMTSRLSVCVCLCGLLSLPPLPPAGSQPRHSWYSTPQRERRRDVTAVTGSGGGGLSGGNRREFTRPTCLPSWLLPKLGIPSRSGRARALAAAPAAEGRPIFRPFQAVAAWKGTFQVVNSCSPLRPCPAPARAPQRLRALHHAPTLNLLS